MKIELFPYKIYLVIETKVANVGYSLVQKEES